MNKILVAAVTAILVFGSPGLAQDISAGSRVTINSDWHAKNGGPYSPQIVSCNSNSGMCLRDTNSKPANKPMTKTKHGLQVAFKDFGIVYLFRSKGAGTFHDMSGKQTGKFSWAQ